jgi:hypothetical protein
MISIILLVFAFVLACVASRWNPPNWALGWLAFACYILSLLLGGNGLGSHFH